VRYIWNRSEFISPYGLSVLEEQDFELHLGHINENRVSYPIIFLLLHVKIYNRRDKDNIFSFLKGDVLFLYLHELLEGFLQEEHPDTVM
jgi:hypothetical protein